MESIDNLFINLFEVQGVTNSRLVTFTQSHLALMQTANPGGAFTPLIVATQPLLTAFEQSLTQRLGSIGLSKSETFGKRKARLAFTAFIRQHEGTVRSVFGKDSGTYREFFPHGLTAYDRFSGPRYET